MKNFPLLFCLVLFFAFAVSAQTNPACPKIDVAGGGVVLAGEPMFFTSNITEINSEKISYQWSVSNGTIIWGQGTQAIQVDTTRLNGNTNITATVEIKGLPEGCGNKFSESGMVEISCGLPIILDLYEKIPFSEEKARLANIVAQLKKEPDSAALFLIRFTEKESLASVRLRVARITKYLSEVQQLSKDKFRFIYSESGFHNTQVYLLPPEAMNNFPDVETDLEKLRPQTSKKTIRKPS